jgi:hypothetical protein
MSVRIRHGARMLRDPQPKSIREIIRVWKNGTRIPNQKGTAKGAILADSMGLGKTATAILAAAKAKLRRILVICPKSAISDWEREIKAWHPNRGMIHKPRNRKTWKKVTLGWTLINYDILGQLATELRRGEWDLVILDEGHYTKEPTAKRSRLVFGGRFKRKNVPAIPTKYKLVISGTPFKNRIEELYDTLSWLDVATWPQNGVYAFIDEFYEDHTDTEPPHPRITTPSKRVVQNVAPKNLAQLHQLLQPVLVRTNKDDLRDANGNPVLPLKRFEKILIPMMDLKIAARFDGWLSSSLVISRMLRQEQRAGDWDKAAELEEMLQGINSKKVKQTAIIKRKFTLEYLLSLPRDKKVIVIGFHRGAMLTQITKGLRKHGRGLVEHNGDNSHRANVTVRKFQNDPKIQFFIGQLHVSNLSLTLTAAHHVVFVEVPNTWTDFNQAMDRSHRFRQEHETKPEFIRVSILDLDWASTNDASLLDAMMRWKYIADVVLDGKPEGELPTWNWANVYVWWKGKLVDANDPDYVAAKREFELEYLQFCFEQMFGAGFGPRVDLRTREYTDHERIIIKIVSFQYKTEANGCSKEEADRAKEMSTEWMKKHNISQAEVDKMRNELQHTKAKAR